MFYYWTIRLSFLSPDKRQDLVDLKAERLRVTGSLAARQVGYSHIVKPHTEESPHGLERTDTQVSHWYHYTESPPPLIGNLERSL